MNFHFGKHKDKSIEEVWRDDPDYLIWMCGPNFQSKDKLTKELVEEVFEYICETDLWRLHEEANNLRLREEAVKRQILLLKKNIKSKGGKLAPSLDL